jgi:hypothetical protein
MAADWTRAEVETIVAAYFEMLAKEQAGVPYTKSETRRRLLPLLNSRSEASVEYKNRNISAVLAKNGQPYITGYIPAYNYQKLVLEEAVFAHLRSKPEVEDAFRQFAEGEVQTGAIRYDQIKEQMPTRGLMVEESARPFRNPVKINYIEREQKNRQIGLTGEGIALEYEKWRLIHAGKESLIDRIEWVSKTQGDGLGFDILSRNTNGTDRYIEVKSTKLTKEAPFFFSEQEFQFSKQNASNFYLYRIYNLRTAPRLFIANGPYDQFCNLRPTHYKATF